MEHSYLDKIKDFRIVPGTFKNDAGQMQDYLSVQVVVTSDGKEETLNLSGGSATKPSALKLALKGADVVGKKPTGSFLENNDDEAPQE